MILKGTLGERQKELNLKVRETVSQKVPFDDLKTGTEESDIDKIFKIDVASHYKNADYLIEVLKSGDSLYISRALKCIWLYDDEHSSVVNPDFLHHNIFPFISIKMKKKLLTAASMYIRNINRVADFYNYCLNSNLKQLALKFLIFTSPEFKENIFINEFDQLWNMIDQVTDVKDIIGDNLNLLEYYLERLSSRPRCQVLLHLRHFFSVNPVRYLNTWEKYYDKNDCPMKNLGLRISKEIMTKHKTRVRENISLYLKLVHRKMFCKHTTADEAKMYAVVMLPNDSGKFWEMKYKKQYSMILELIPEKERYQYIRKIFKEKYPESEFEMSKQFYDECYYDFMSIEEREKWALCHLANPHKTFLSEVSNNDMEYLWYGFVNYDKAITGIKKYIAKTPDAYKRSLILNVLIESARSQEQLENLFKYYHERHVNENRTSKEDFINKITDVHEVWEFDENCWAAFEKILHSIELYNPKDKNFNSWNSQHILSNALIYYVLHKSDLPNGLELFAQSDMKWDQIEKLLERIKKSEHKELIYQFLRQLYENKIKSRFEDKPYNETIKFEVRYYIGFIKAIMKYFKKPEDELPEIVLKYMGFDVENYYPKAKDTPMTQSKMIRFLKQDPSMTVTSIPLLEAIMTKQYDFKMNTYLNKLRVYFSNDIGRTFLEYFQKSLKNAATGRSNLFSSVFGIFALADDITKVKFMKEHIPIEPKIDYSTTDRNLLYIQEGICRFACYSRPPIPLETMLLFVKGDFVRYCLPMFNKYVAILPLEICLKFVEALLNTPVSIQKHGLRLAFKCFSNENLTNLLLKVWKKQKNLSLRMIIYTSLHKKLMVESDEIQAELFKIFLTLTSDIHHEDHEDIIYTLIRYNQIPEIFRAAYLNVAWKTVNKFPDNKINLERKTKVIKNIIENIYSMDKTDKKFIRPIIDDYLNDIFVNKHIVPSEERNKFIELNNVKLCLTSGYIVSSHNEEKETSLELLKLILHKCFEQWNDTTVTRSPTYYARSYFFNFINVLENEDFKVCKDDIVSVNNVLFENIINYMQNTLPLHEIYIHVWRLQTLIFTNKILESGKAIKQNYHDKKDLLKTISEAYADEIIKLIKCFVDKQIFLLSFLDSIAKELELHITKMFIKLELQTCESDVEFTRIFVASKLTNCKINEAALLSVLLLPIPSTDETLTDLKCAIRNIKMFENFEIQALLHHKMNERGFLKLTE